MIEDEGANNAYSDFNADRGGNTTNVVTARKTMNAHLYNLKAMIAIKAMPITKIIWK